MKILQAFGRTIIRLDLCLDENALSEEIGLCATSGLRRGRTSHVQEIIRWIKSGVCIVDSAICHESRNPHIHLETHVGRSTVDDRSSVRCFWLCLKTDQTLTWIACMLRVTAMLLS